MDITYHTSTGVAVTLSVKNLLALLAEATANNGHAGLVRDTASGFLAIHVEPDADHYAARAEHPALRGKLLRH